MNTEISSSRRKPGATTPAAGGANISGSQASETLVEGGSLRAVPSAEGLAVVERPKPAEVPVEACSDEIPPPAYDPREVSFNHQAREAAMQERIARLEQMNYEWAQYGAAHGVLTPMEMGEAILSRNQKIYELEDELASLRERIASLEANRSLLLDEPSVKDSLTTADMINHPPHYQGKVECIDAIESALGKAGFVAYCRGNAMKYTFRAGRKGDAAEDLEKARWYLSKAKESA